MNPTIVQEENEVFLTHRFNAPRELVFQAWTDPQQLLQWYAPDGCRIEFKNIDVKSGGTYHSCIHDPVYGECWCKGEYIDILYPEKLVFTMEMTDASGSEISSEAAGKDEAWPSKTTVTVTFEEADGQTILTLHQTVSAVLAQKTGALPGWRNMLDRLSAMVARAGY